MAEKVFFLYDNKVDSGTVTASSTAGNLVAANLQDRRLRKVARTAGIASEWWRVDFGATVEIDTVAVWGHNFGLDATLRIRLSANSDLSSPVYDATDYAWPGLYGWGDLGWAGDGLGGLPLDFDGAEFKPFSVFRLGARYSGRYLRIDPVETGNADGYFEAGRLVAGVGWQPTRNFSLQWELEWVDPSEQQEMESGAVWVDVREKYRLLTLPFGYATKADALASFGDLARIVGSSRDLLVLPFPDVTADRHRTAIYGIPPKSGLSAVRQTGLNQFTFSVQVREITG